MADTLGREPYNLSEENMPRKHGRYGAMVGELNAYDMVPGFRPLMDAFGIYLGKEPDLHILNILRGMLGSEECIRLHRPQVAAGLMLDGLSKPNTKLLDLISRTGALSEIQARTVFNTVRPQPNSSVKLLLYGGLIPHMRKLVAKAVDIDRYSLYRITEVCTIGSFRPCTHDLELNDPLVIAAAEDGEQITEYNVLRTLIRNAGFKLGDGATGGTYEDAVKAMFHRNWLDFGQIVVPTVGGQTYKALLTRRMIREVSRKFDQERNQFWFCQGFYPLARTPEQAADPAHYARPLDALAGIVQWVFELFMLYTNQAPRAA